MTDRPLIEIMGSEEYERTILLTLKRAAPAIEQIMKEVVAQESDAGPELCHAMANALLPLVAWLAEASGFCNDDPGDPIRQGRWLEMCEDAWKDRPPQGNSRRFIKLAAASSPPRS